MSPRSCEHESNLLLPWYVNGSLEGAEEARVGEHLRGCAVCAAEERVLALIARGLSRQGMPPEEAAAPRSRLAKPLALAAAGIAVAICVYVVVRLLEGRGIVDPGPSDLTGAVVLDLGSGPPRSQGDSPRLAIEPETRLVVVKLNVPPRRGARYSLVIQGPDGRGRGRREPLTNRDAFGSFAPALPVEWFSDDGLHLLLVQEEGPEGQTRSYPFAVQVGRTASPRAP